VKREQYKSAYRIYLILAALFITALVVCNLIFLKFFEWNPFGLFRFEISVGLLPYPITFLITDLISEIYGRKQANQVVLVGLFAAFFSIFIVLLADFVPAMDSSAVDDATFTQVFGLSPIGVLASMIAYLLAQFIDIRIYHFWKRITKGKHLWLRNNFSTFTSQLIDTFTVITLLCYFDALPWERYTYFILSGFLFKVIFAALDTPLLYFFVWLFRKKFNLAVGEEIKLNA